MTDLWTGIERHLDTCPRDELLGAQGVHLIAAIQRKAAGRPVPSWMDDAVKIATVNAVIAPRFVREIAGIIDAPTLILKGPELAAAYPTPAMRSYGDLDLLVADPVRAQRRLIEAGFSEAIDDEVQAPHHLPYLFRAGSPFGVEVHRDPGWLWWMTGPTTEELLAAAVPSATGVAGALALPPAQHAVYASVHAWRHGPLGGLRHLIDVAALADGVDDAELHAVTSRWQARRLWRLTDETIGALFLDRTQRPLALRTWGRNLNTFEQRREWSTWALQAFRRLAADRPSAAAKAMLDFGIDRTRRLLPGA